jgi:4-hydroxy-tetrahydrodipicolinate synthase
MARFTGTFTALITPFRNGKIDQPALEKLVQMQLDADIDGLVPCGTTGESPTLSSDEYAQVVKTVVKLRDQSGKKTPVLAGAGANCTDKTVELSKKMLACGADGLLIVAPYYNKPSQEGLYQHYVAVCRAAGKAPVMLYNIPGRCGVEVATATIRRIREACDNLNSVKHATGKVEGVSEVLAECPVDVLSGDDPLTLPMMSIGAIGVVSVLSNLAPKLVRKLTSSANAGDWKTAREVHDRLFALGRTLLGLDINPVPIKTAMAMRGVCTEEFRLPMAPLSADKRRELQALLERSGELS